MIDVIAVKFKRCGKLYDFLPGQHSVQTGDYVVVETSQGVELAKVAIVHREIDETNVETPLREIVRVATEEDLSVYESLQHKAKEAHMACLEKIIEHGLEMKLVNVEYTFDCSQITFYFTAEGRVDFRELVKDLAAMFHTRIELRQIGVRDEAKIIGGLGICGRSLCCHSYLEEFSPVSIKMAKEQSLSLNPSKISGSCGRLLCCLNYENENYIEWHKTCPNCTAADFSLRKKEAEEAKKRQIELEEPLPQLIYERENDHDVQIKETGSKGKGNKSTKQKKEEGKAARENANGTEIIIEEAPSIEDVNKAKSNSRSMENSGKKVKTVQIDVALEHADERTSRDKQKSKGHRFFGKGRSKGDGKHKGSRGKQGSEKLKKHE